MDVRAKNEQIVTCSVERERMDERTIDRQEDV